MSLKAVALGFALCEHDNAVREVGGNNQGPRIKKYLANTMPPINVAAPWCCAFTNYCADIAAQGLGVLNPLDEVKHEALVQSVVDWAHHGGNVVAIPEPGDLVAYRFNKAQRWNHIGFVLRPPDRLGMLATIEGNTGPPDGDQREGDGVYLKMRFLSSQPTCFIRWAA